jgi:hypothetical protein
MLKMMVGSTPLPHVLTTCCADVAAVAPRGERLGDMCSVASMLGRMGLAPPASCSAARPS